ncbi:MAG TPA: AraC family transcriptional regulator [Pelobium sp.]
MCLLHLISSFVLIIEPENKKTDKYQLMVNSSIQFMKQHVDSNLSTAELASNASLSVSHFSSTFKRITGVSAMAYFNQLKMNKACDYLKYSDTLVKEISYKLGIYDVQYFSRLFVKTIGITPLKYRKRHKSI